MSALKVWFAIATRPAIVKRSVRVALVVGTALTLINQGGRLLALDIDAPTLANFRILRASSKWSSLTTPSRLAPGTAKGMACAPTAMSSLS